MLQKQEKERRFFSPKKNRIRSIRIIEQHPQSPNTKDQSNYHKNRPSLSLTFHPPHCPSPTHLPPTLIHPLPTLHQDQSNHPSKPPSSPNLLYLCLSFSLSASLSPVSKSSPQVPSGNPWPSPNTLSAAFASTPTAKAEAKSKAWDRR